MGLDGSQEPGVSARVTPTAVLDPSIAVRINSLKDVLEHRICILES